MQLLRKGSIVQLVAAIVMPPYYDLAVGERGRVSYIDPETKAIEITLKKRHKSLAEWNNCLFLFPSAEDHDGLVDSLVEVTPTGLRPLRSRAFLLYPDAQPVVIEMRATAV